MAIVLLSLAFWLLIGEPGGRRQPQGHLTHRILTDRSGTTYTYDVPLRRQLNPLGQAAAHGVRIAARPRIHVEMIVCWS